MEKRIKNYLLYLEKLSKNKDKLTDADRANILTQIGFFQHERLIHLIVTVTFAILTIIALIACLFADNVFLLILTVLLMVLLVPYIRHYYILENSVQRMYVYFDLFFNTWE